VTAGQQVPVDLVRDLAAVRAGGWEAIEVWLDHWDAHFPPDADAAARRVLDESGLAVAGACAQEGLFFARGDESNRRRSELSRRLERCAALGVTHLVVVPVPPPEGEPPGEDELDRAAQNLHAAGELALASGVGLEIEFLAGARLVNNLATALELARRVDHAAVGVLVDTYHLYAGPSKLEDLDLLAAHPGRLRFVHVDDVPAARPRELWTDADRVLPGDGDLPLAHMLGAIRRSGYTGDVSLELFNAEVAARWQVDPAGVAAEAFRRVSGLLEAV
jgi:sugar phosphate isomerase/epimerase